MAKRDPDKPLSPAEAVFVAEYQANGGKGGPAVKVAWPNFTSDNAAAVHATEVLKRPNVRSILKQSGEKLMKRSTYTVDRILREQAELASADLRAFVRPNEAGGVELVPPTEWTGRMARTVKSLTIHPDGSIKLTLYDRQRALAELARYNGMRRVKHELGDGTASLVELLLLAAKSQQEDRAQRAIPVTVDVDAKVVDVPDGHVLGYENGNSGNDESLDKNRANMEPDSPDHPGQKDPPGGSKP